ncbi:hypothetical protein LTR53_018086, partial [Teratosphaeriaceae sp. CCFEE 6253]
MLVLRWSRRRARAGHRALPPNAGVSPSPDLSDRGAAAGGLSRSHPGMAERAGLMPVLGAVPALFRHQNRSREMGGGGGGSASGSEAAGSGSGSGERGFTRVSGRKLPSSFSPGMSSPGLPPTMPLTGLGGGEGNLSTTSFYRDSAGFYGGGTDTEASATPGSGAGGGVGGAGEREALTLSPGPQRRPTVHTGGPYVLASPTRAASPGTPGTPGWGGGGGGGSGGNPFAAAELEGSPGVGGAIGVARSGTPDTMELGRGSRFVEE